MGVPGQAGLLSPAASASSQVDLACSVRSRLREPWTPHRALASTWAQNSALRTLTPSFNPVRWEWNHSHCTDRETESVQSVLAGSKPRAAPVRPWLPLTLSQAESPTSRCLPRAWSLVFIVFRWGDGPYLSWEVRGEP